MSLLVLIGTFSDAFIYITFKINQDYIAQELCINLDKPEVMCQGKCFLDDQLAKVNTTPANQDHQTPTKFEKKDIPLFYKTNKAENLTTYSSSKPTWKSYQVAIYYYEKHLLGVFHPPQS